VRLGARLFLVKGRLLLTPALAHSVLGGLTRDTVRRLARERASRGARVAPSRAFCTCGRGVLHPAAVEITAIAR